MEEVERRLRAGEGLCATWVRLEGLVACESYTSDTSVRFALHYDLGAGGGCVVDVNNCLAALPSTDRDRMHRQFCTRLLDMAKSNFWLCDPMLLLEESRKEHANRSLGGNYYISSANGLLGVHPSRICVMLLTARLQSTLMEVRLELFLAAPSRDCCLIKTCWLKPPNNFSDVIPIITQLIARIYALRQMAPLLSRALVHADSRCIACDAPTTRAHAASHWIDRDEHRELFLCGS